MAIKKFHAQAVTNELLTLIRELMADNSLSFFNLVGGTALSLLLGHRRSMDIDLFSNRSFNAANVADYLAHKYELDQYSVEENSVSGFVRGIRIDLISHRYRMIDSVEQINGIRIMGIKDLTAMKLNAIANRGSKKDFWDCAKLLEHYSLDEQLAWYSEKYPQANLWQVQKSLCYFEDAENDPDPETLDRQTWGGVKHIIKAAVQI